MKQRAITLFTLLLCLVYTNLYAYDAKIDGIYYNFSGTEAMVASYSFSSDMNKSAYSGELLIPDKVECNGKFYTVISIDEQAFQGCSELLSVTIPNSVTTIANHAFKGCTSLVSVNIPNSVTTIKHNAFEGCSALVSITIPNRLTEIDYNVFSECSGLTSLTIPNSVTVIAINAFYGCSSLTSLTIPKNIVSIGESAFANCTHLSSVRFEDSEEAVNLKSETVFKNCPIESLYIGRNIEYPLFSPFRTILKLSDVSFGAQVTKIPNNSFLECRGLHSVSIANSVTSIDDYAFYGCSGLTNITIPQSVTSIGRYAFSGCSGLAIVTIPNSINSVGGAAFADCTRLTSVKIEDGNEILTISEVNKSSEVPFYNCPIESLYLGRNMSYVSYSPFSNNSNLNQLLIGDYVTSISSNAFLNCNGLTSISFPNSVISIGSNAFKGCSGLTSVTIPNNVISIGSSVFSDCTGLISVTIEDGTEELRFSPITVDSWNPFYNCPIETLYLGRNLSYSSTFSPFSKNRELRNLSIGENVTSIGDYAFDFCTGLTSVTIPSKVTSIGSRAFFGCNLNSLTIGTSVLTIGQDAFNKPVKTIWLTNTPPSGYTYAEGSINYVANSNYTSINSSKKKVYEFLSSMFEVDGVKYVPVSLSERTCDAIDCAYNSTAENIEIGEDVTYKGVLLKVNNVNPYAFYRNTFTKSVALSFSGDVGNYAFYDCNALQTAAIGEKVTSIGSYAFSGCSVLERFIISDAVQALGAYAFQGCTAMTSVKIGSGLTALPTYAFANCSSLPSIQIPQLITSVGNYAFSGCTALKEVVINDRETTLTLGSNGSSPLFASCPLDTVYIGGDISYDKYSSYGYSPFYRNTSLRSIKITDKENEISENEFYGCTNLKNVWIGDGVTTIGKWAFSGCSSLQNFAFGESVASIGDEAFSDCTAVTKITSKAATPPACGTQALDDINKWECTLYVPSDKVATYQAADQWKEFLFVAADDLAADAVTITAKSYTRKYGEANPAFGYESGGKTVVGKPEISCDATASTPVGDYAIVVGRGTVTNGDATFVNGKLTITKTPLTISVGNYSRKVGEANPAFTAEYWGWKNGETESVLTSQPVITCQATASSPAGEYNIVVSGADAQNYEITYVAGKLTVGEAEPDEYGVDKIGLLTDAIYVKELQTSPGAQLNVAVRLKNAQPAAGYQFDVELPMGFSLADDGYSLSSRNVADCSLSMSQISDNSYRFIAHSASSTTMAAGDEAVLTLRLLVAGDASIGSSELKVLRAYYALADASTVSCKDIVTPITIATTRQGDANNDGSVDVSDVVAVVNYILGKPTGLFTATAADVNGDGNIDVGDVVGIVNIILGKSAGARSMVKYEGAAASTMGDAVSLWNGEHGELSLRLDNQGEYVAAQFDVRLSEGMTLDEVTKGQRARGHQLATAKMGEGVYRVLLYTIGDRTFSGQSGEVVSLGVAGEGDVTVENITFITAGESRKKFDSLSNQLTGIDAVLNDKEEMINDKDVWYNLQGRRLETAPTSKGVYLKNGKKVVVK